jgi:phenylpyruvate tautomerase PptA (4-oxalocrotonate tautomerase family)
MPLVRIDLRSGRTPEFRRALGDAVYRAMIETANVPRDDRFEVIAEHDDSGLLYDPAYLGVLRSSGIVLVQITLNTGRSVAVKQALYQRIADLMAELGVRREDVFVSLVEVPKENWSFGNGIAQYVD